MYKTSQNEKKTIEFLKEDVESKPKYLVKVFKLAIYKILEFNYVTVYFYFFPFSILLLVFMFVKD